MTAAAAELRARGMETTVMLGAPGAVDLAAAVARRFGQTWGLVEWGDALEKATAELTDGVLRSASGPVPNNYRPFAIRVRVRWTSSSTVLVEAWGILASTFGFVAIDRHTGQPSDQRYWICRVDRLRVRGRGIGVQYV